MWTTIQLMHRKSSFLQTEHRFCMMNFWKNGSLNHILQYPHSYLLSLSVLFVWIIIQQGSWVHTYLISATTHDAIFRTISVLLLIPNDISDKGDSLLQLSFLFLWSPHRYKVCVKVCLLMWPVQFWPSTLACTTTDTSFNLCSMSAPVDFANCLKYIHISTGVTAEERLGELKRQAFSP